MTSTLRFVDGSAEDPLGQTGPLLSNIVQNGLPAEELAVFARWWQLESWLRDLAYTELRARDGVRWIEAVGAASGRQSTDAEYVHMTSPDNENPVAFLDYSQLLDIIEKNWTLFQPTLLPLVSWKGRQADLTRVRHRMAHLRRPAPDDLGRIGQTLRDLERGAFIAAADYNDRWIPGPEHRDDAVADGWLIGTHPDAQRLIDHAASRYDTRLRLRKSARPWAAEGEGATSGVLWHADFFVGETGVDLASLWRDVHGTAAERLLLDLSSDSPGHVGFTFPAADDPAAIADAIGVAFESLLTSGRDSGRGSGHDAWEMNRDQWRELDYRVRVNTIWNIVDASTLPISIFGAGGPGVTRDPRV